MGWSINHQKMHNSDLKSFFFGVVGRLLYLANHFEEKCSFVLKVAKLEEHIEENGSLPVSDELVGLLKDKMLGKTIIEMGEIPSFTKDDIDALDKARKARNLIAHEGAAIGYPITTVRSKLVLDQLTKLREAMTDLIEGDNLVSGWVYEITEKDYPPQDLIADYPQRVAGWVFSGVDLDQLKQMDFTDDDPLTWAQFAKMMEGRTRARSRSHSEANEE